MKKFLKIIGIIIGVLVLGIGILFLSLNKKEPVGETGAAADALAKAMEKSVNKVAWDSTKYLAWNFAAMRQFVWDKERHFVKVMWDGKVVLLHTKTVSGLAYVDGNLVEGAEKEELIQEAWSHFCNDSFWLNPIVKTFDSGVQRSVVTLDDGSKALKVSYMEGGVTPGDSYLWILDENNRPKEWKLWVGIIPIGGVAFSWEDWQTLSTGATVAGTHKGKIFDLVLSDMKGGMNPASIGLNEDPFTALANK